MRLALPALIILLLVGRSPDAFACREAERTHETRLAAADVAAVARVSAVSAPSLERPDYDDERDRISSFERTIRLVVVQPLKGNPSKRIELTLSHCQGSLSAEVGLLVYVYEIHGQWRITSNPPRPEVRVPR